MTIAKRKAAFEFFALIAAFVLQAASPSFALAQGVTCEGVFLGRTQTTELERETQDLSLIDSMKLLLNIQAAPRQNNFFTSFSRQLPFDGPYIHSTGKSAEPLGPPVLTMIEFNPRRQIDPDVERIMIERTERLARKMDPKQAAKRFSAHWFAEGNRISFTRLYEAYAQQGPEIASNIETYRAQDKKTFATHLIFALPLEAPKSQEARDPHDIDSLFPPTHEYIARAQGIGSYSPEHRLNVERDFNIDLGRKPRELWLELGRTHTERKADLSEHAQGLVDGAGGWSALQRIVLLRQMLWLGHDVQPDFVVLHINDAMVRYAKRAVRAKSLRIVHTMQVETSPGKFANEHVAVLTKGEIRRIQDALFIEHLLASLAQAELRGSSGSDGVIEATLSPGENAVFKRLALDEFFKGPLDKLKRKVLGEDAGVLSAFKLLLDLSHGQRAKTVYQDFVATGYFSLESRKLAAFRKFLLARQSGLAETLE